jgi:hypothetical protein
MKTAMNNLRTAVRYMPVVGVRLLSLMLLALALWGWGGAARADTCVGNNSPVILVKLETSGDFPEALAKSHYQDFLAILVEQNPSVRWTDQSEL